MDRFDIVTTAQYICSLAAGFAGYAMGGLDLMLKILLIASLLDILTGILQAFYQKKLNSTVGSRGMIRKIGIYIMVSIACMLDAYMGIDFLRETVITFYIWNELVSIAENWGKMGLPMPEKLRNSLVQLNPEETNKTPEKTA